MPVLLSCESLTKSFTSRPLFENLSFAINAGDHIGLVGPNGSGKTTLLKIVAGIDQPDSGTRAVRKGVRVGYVPQDAVFTPGMSIDPAGRKLFQFFCSSSTPFMVVGGAASTCLATNASARAFNKVRRSIGLLSGCVPALVARRERS